MINTSIIFAGGKGTRLRSEESSVPTLMAPVNGRPFLSLILDHLIEQDIKIVILAVGHLYQKVIEFYGDQYHSLTILYSIESKPLGTGGAINQALTHSNEDDVLVINGDNYVQFSLKSLIEFYKYNQKNPIVLLKKLKEFDRYGAVSISTDFQVDNFHKKKFCKEGYINAGVYLVNKSIFTNISKERFSFEKEILEKALPNHNWFGYPQNIYFKDIGISEDYFQFISDDENSTTKENLEIDRTWTLFLDRDGVINKRKIGGYIETVEEFEFLPGAVTAIKKFSKIFGRIIIVTNQQGIGKGIFSAQDLQKIHKNMVLEIIRNGGKIDHIYFCPKLANHNPKCRKPNTGMGICAKIDFPEIYFSKSIMVGDSASDIEFGKRLGMKCIKITSSPAKINDDFTFTSLIEFSNNFEFNLFQE